MEYRPDVAWKTGINLTPQHFQLWDRHLKSLFMCTLDSLHGYMWGIDNIEIDHQSLEQGRFHLKYCSGLTKSGSYFRLSERDQSLPGPRDFVEVYDSPTDVVSIFLVLPRENSFECSYEDVVDKYDRSVEKIEVVIPNYQLAFDKELTPENSKHYKERMKIAQVRDVGSKKPKLDPSFMPTSLRASIFSSRDEKATGQTLSYVENTMYTVLDNLRKRGNSLSALLHDEDPSFPSLAQPQILLSAVNSAALTLRHLLESKNCHPEILYRFALSLIGNLWAFVLKGDIVDKAELHYEHENLSRSFARVGEILESLLLVEETVDEISFLVPKKSETHEHEVFICDLNKSLLESGKLYLFYNGSLREGKIEEVLRISSPDLIDDLIEVNTTGLLPVLVTKSPVSAKGKDDFKCFEIKSQAEVSDEEGEPTILRQDDPHWQAVQKTGKIAINCVTGSEFNLELTSFVQLPK